MAGTTHTNGSAALSASMLARWASTVRGWRCDCAVSQPIGAQMKPRGSARGPALRLGAQASPC
jgi:hypothetical protein